MKVLNTVGRRVPMHDAAAKATGQAQFTDDLLQPGVLWGKLLRSPISHGRIISIDVSRAEALPGVKGVITGQDIPDRPYGIVPKAKDEYALARDRVRYIGDEVAAVVAVDSETAEEAVRLIEVEYEELPAVFDPLDAIKDGAPLVHDDTEGNVSAQIHKEWGNVEEGFAQADHVFEDSFYSQAVNHAPMEPHAAVATYDAQDGNLTVWSATQIPYFLKRNLATTLDIPESKVRVIKPKVGGGFGQKIDMFAKDFCAGWFARQLGLPVKFVYDRDEVFQSTRQRHPMYLTVKTGVNKDGEIVAQKITAHADGGAYNSTAPLMITLSCFFIMIPYRIQTLSYEGYRVYMVTLIAHILNPVGNHDEKAGEGDHERGRGVVGAPVRVGLDLLGHNLPVFVDSGFYREIHGVSLPGALEDLVPIVNEFDRQAQLPRKPTRAEVLGEHIYLLTEPPTDLGLDHPDLALRYVQGSSQVPLQKVRDLSSRPDGEVPILRIISRNRCMRLHGRMVHSLGVERVLKHMIRLRKTLFHIPHSLWIWALTLPSVSSCTSGAPSLMASSGSKTAGSSSYSTSMSRTASSAVSESTATTAATSSPIYRTLSRARAYSSLALGTIPYGRSGISCPVMTPFTPGRASALETSILIMRPWEMGDLSSLPHSTPG